MAVSSPFSQFRGRLSPSVSAPTHPPTGFRARDLSGWDTGSSHSYVSDTWCAEVVDNFIPSLFTSRWGKWWATVYQFAWWVFRSCWESWSRPLKLKQNRPNPCRERFLGLRDEDSQVLFMLGTLHQQHRMHGDVNMYAILPYVSETAVFAKVRCNLCGGERACVLFYLIIHGLARSLVLNCPIFLGEIWCFCRQESM